MYSNTCPCILSHCVLLLIAVSIRLVNLEVASFSLYVVAISTINWGLKDLWRGCLPGTPSFWWRKVFCTHAHGYLQAFPRIGIINFGIKAYISIGVWTTCHRSMNAGRSHPLVPVCSCFFCATFIVIGAGPWWPNTWTWLHLLLYGSPSLDYP